MSQPVKTCLAGDDIFTVEHFLSDEACDDLIGFSESSGFEPATVHTAGGQHLLEDWRNNMRVIVDDTERASWLWQRAQSYVPEIIDGRQATGVNERLRFYRYDSGQQFDWHTDGYFLRENGEQSYLTFMVYLNGDMDGGETSFSDLPFSPSELTVTPATGLALFFTHMLNHKGEPVKKGRKYVLRSDIMYSP